MQTVFLKISFGVKYAFLVFVVTVQASRCYLVWLAPMGPTAGGLLYDIGANFSNQYLHQKVTKYEKHVAKTCAK